MATITGSGDDAAVAAVAAMGVVQLSGHAPPPMTPPIRDDAELLEANRRFYDRLWSEARLVAPERFNTWPLASALAAAAARRLEVAPGLRPRLPIAGTCFADISLPAIRALHAEGGQAVLGQVTALPFADAAFDLVCALDIVEHVDDDGRAFAELARVAAPGASLLLAVPLHVANWTEFDHFVGHRRRYEPAELVDQLAGHGFRIERSAIYGMQPRSTRLLDLGIWFLVHQRARAMWWYNRVGMPLALRFEKPLRLQPGLISTADINTALLVCSKAG